MAESLSVIIASRNCANRIEATIKPWLWANEVIVADQMSTDDTPLLAHKMGAKVFSNNPPGDNFDLNRKLAMLKAESQWVLYIDTDERPTPELIEELKNFLKNPPKEISGVKIPNQFYFLGKALRHGIYNPRSAEIRLMRQGTWHYPCEEGYHRGISVKSGQVICLKNSYKHFNVNSLSEWFIKTNQYTELDASVDRSSTCKALANFFKFFLKHYFWKLGFLDGWHGFLATFYFGLYHFTLSSKSWEKSYLNQCTLEHDYLKPLEIPKR